MTNDRPPRALTLTCNGCHIQVWSVPMDPGNMDKKGWKRYLFLSTDHVSDNVTITTDGYAVFDNYGTGEYTQHKCPERITVCKYCRWPVRIVYQRNGEIAVLDADPKPAGVICMRGEYAVNDPNFRLTGERFFWHSRHGE